MIIAVYAGPLRTLPAWLQILALVAAVALVAGVWAGTHGGAGQRGRGTPATAGLLVRGHSQSVAVTLTGGASLRGTLYPALPGTNVVRLTLAGVPGAAGAGTLRIRVLMPGMVMVPVRATLRGQQGRYQGSIALPMFGAYRAQVVLVTPRGHWQGPLDLVVPLTTSQ